MRLARVISAMLGAAATPATNSPRVSGAHADWRVMLEPVVPEETNGRRPQPADPRRGASAFAASFPTQSARAALLDECVVKAQERARLIKAAIDSRS